MRLAEKTSVRDSVKKKILVYSALSTKGGTEEGVGGGGGGGLGGCTEFIYSSVWLGETVKKTD